MNVYLYIESCSCPRDEIDREPLHADGCPEARWWCASAEPVEATVPREHRGGVAIGPADGETLAEGVEAIADALGLNLPADGELIPGNDAEEAIETAESTGVCVDRVSSC